LLSRRFLLSLVVGLSLSTLASTNSANVNMTFLHSALVSMVVPTLIWTISRWTVEGHPAIFAASNDQFSPGKSRKCYLSGPLSGTVMDGPARHGLQNREHRFSERDEWDEIQNRQLGWCEAWDVHSGTASLLVLSTA